ncbi:hypothetical protein BX616_007879 [Lobosporangium transversale]|uniref:Dolichol-phosphate mannosyltransferase subunit 3 n=1 Tax=Lobosporangium transversale TaxID=64571 RepID=A0A1Y2GP44_9FUNG|nr:dolichol-phosphate mannosyltransferase subunit 3 [Lobosporangium transversale]KAF9914643.1 hypothetical protein BX616_007879 [Lobosporangium transversale]ORZ16828.1 dolichol-phosphate mannosyltransferase subunit 3 [Lobosporangium transversale]|eukprot:XP_021881763.1 dolichol-phosphate mannosyltransferase subunit 3 [Lobosporangium transversale]
MTRATEAATFFGITAAIYFALLFQWLPITLPKTVQEFTLPVLPWWALVTFGAYSLGNIGYHVLTFRDCPEAYVELQTQISQAQNDLRSKGVTI